MSVSPIAKGVGYVCLTLWILAVFFLYLKINWGNVDYCLKIYATVLGHTQTLLLFLIPCLVIAFVASAIYITKSFASRRG